MPSYRVGPGQWMAASTFGAALAKFRRQNINKVKLKSKGPIGRMALKRQSKKKYATRTTLFQKPKANVPGMTGGGTFTTFSHKHALTPWQKGLKKNGAENTYNDTSTGLFQWRSGQQTVNVFTGFGTYPDIQTFFTGSQPPALNPLTRKILLQDYSIICYISNTSSGPVTVDLYDIVPRDDMPDQNLRGQSNDPSAAFADGLVDAGASGGASIVVGTTPFQSPKFCQLWKVVKVSKIQLAQGSTHEHRVHFEVNQMINNARFQNGDLYYRGPTYYCMSVMHGMPSIGDDGVTVTASEGQVAAVFTRKVNWTQISDSESQLTNQNGLPASINTNVINVGSGAAAHIVNA